MQIDFQTIPHNHQRYPTVGDYWWDGDVLKVRVSCLSRRVYEWLVFIHEFIEIILTMLAEIPEPRIAEWDRDYEAHRPGMDANGSSVMGCGCYVTEDSEPGDDPHAPYHKQHVIAEICERTAALFLGVSWNAYTDEINSL